MSWDNNDDKSLKDKDRDYISKDNEYEIPAMIKKFHEKHHKLTPEEIEKVINDCMDKSQPPYPRDEIEKCIESILRIKTLIK